MKVSKIWEDEAFLRRVTPPEEDCQRTYPDVVLKSEYRWFRSPNVIPLEQWRARKQKQK
jgi:hypothetical protein